MWNVMTTVSPLFTQPVFTRPALIPPRHSLPDLGPTRPATPPAITATGEQIVDTVLTFEVDPQEEMKAHLRVDMYPEHDDDEELAMASMALKESSTAWVELMDEEQQLTARVEMRVSNK